MYHDYHTNDNKKNYKFYDKIVKLIISNIPQIYKRKYKNSP